VRWGLILALVPILLVAGGTFIALRSDLLTVQQVNIEGTSSLDQGALVEISGLQGESMLRLPLDDARRRLLATPAIRSVTIERNWPNAVTITVEERLPVAFWSAGGHEYVVDQDGVVLAAGTPDGPAPRIIDLTSGLSLAPGDRVHPDAIAFARRITAESPRFLEANVLELEYRAGIGVTVVFDGGLRVTFGDERSYEYKIAVLSELLESLSTQGVQPTAVDLRFGERVTYE
jgi:cell division protein FtsQ